MGKKGGQNFGEKDDRHQFFFKTSKISPGIPASENRNRNLSNFSTSPHVRCEMM